MKKEGPVHQRLLRAMRYIIKCNIPQNIKIILKNSKEDIVLEDEDFERAFFNATEVHVILRGKARKIKYEEIESFKRIAKN